MGSVVEIQYILKYQNARFEETPGSLLQIADQPL